MKHSAASLYVKKGVTILVIILVSLVLWMVSALQEFMVFAPYFFPISGFPLEKNYLLLFQNDSEARPTGGFITSYVKLKFRFGIPSFEMNDVYSLNGYKDDIYREPPYPIKELFSPDTFYKGYAFHDANFSPDFPTSCETLMQFLKDDENMKDTFDGCIAINSSLLERMLEIVGPITVRGTEVTSDTVYYTLESIVMNVDKHNLEEVAKRKGVLREVMSAIQKKAGINLPIYFRLMTMMGQQADQKEILFHFSNPKLESLVEKRQWNGRVFSPIEVGQNGDLVQVVETNLGGRKSDRYISKTIDHTLTVTSEFDDKQRRKIIGETRVGLRHLGYLNEPISNVYQGYLRWYLPKDAQVLSEDKELTVTEELGYKVVGKIVRVNPQTEGTFTLQYQLPYTLLDTGKLTTYIYKQPGSVRTQYRVSTVFPGEYTVESTDMTTKDHMAYKDFDGLTNNTKLDLSFKPDGFPPRVASQQFQALNTILLEWNEKINPQDCVAANVSMYDKDTKDTLLSDKVRISSVRCKDNFMTIKTIGIREQPEEFYGVTLKNISDTSQNLLMPNPREYIVVQRLPKE